MKNESFVSCSICERPIALNDIVIELEHDYLCEDCFREVIENARVTDLAERMGCEWDFASNYLPTPKESGV